MAYSLCPATVDDAPAIAEVFRKAFEKDHVIGLFHPNTPKDILIDKDTNYFAREIGKGYIFGKRYTKIVADELGKTVAFAAWHYPLHLTPELEAEKNIQAEEAKKELCPPGSQDALIEDFFKKVSAGRKKWIDPEKIYFMHILAVHPDHQGKGLAGRLLRPVLDESDRVGAQSYIEASPAGMPVYLKYGWKLIDEMCIDMRPYGGQGIEHVPFLMREPHEAKVMT